MLTMSATMQIFTLWKLRGLKIAGSLQERSALYIYEKGLSEPHDNYRTYNYHGVSLKFLQPFFIDSADFPSNNPANSCPRSFHGVKICSVLLIW